jgi:menaquinone-dependent protoporphyrinogen oxidase
MRVLVTAASRHEATQEIAEAIGRTLEAWGMDADVRRVGDVHELDGYDAVVLGSGVYAGKWLESARTFAEEHGDELRGRPTWLFSSGPVGDPQLPAADSAVQVGDLVDRTAARGHRLFPGRLDKDRLGLGERAVVRAVGVAEGDFRDWDEISSWAEGIADALDRDVVPGPKLVPPPEPTGRTTTRLKGVPWFAFMVGMWATFALLAVARPEALDDLWSWVRDLPLLAEGVVWLLFFPWVLGLAVWESSWDGWFRLLLVSCFAAGWTIVSLPRRVPR